MQNWNKIKSQKLTESMYLIIEFKDINNKTLNFTLGIQFIQKFILKIFSQLQIIQYMNHINQMIMENILI